MSGKGKKATEPGYHFLLKVAVIGEAGVGKSALLAAEDAFNGEVHLSEENEGDEDGLHDAPGNAGMATASVAASKARLGDRRSGSGTGACIRFKTRDYTHEQYQYRFQYWDCPGQGRYKALTQKFCSGACGYLFVFELTDMKSFESLADWVSAVKPSSRSALVLVGNKAQCLGAPRQVARKTAEEFAAFHGMSYFETDALSRTGCSKVYEALLRTTIKAIPTPAEPRELLNLDVKIGPALLADKKFRLALASASASSGGASESSFSMDWL